MMHKKKGLELLALSFFKTEKIDYFYDQSTIIFPCFLCGNETKMNGLTTEWECRTCSQSGKITTLITLIEQNRNDVKAKNVYKPSKARKDITNAFDRLINVSDGKGSIELMKLREEVEILINYLIEEKKQISNTF